MQVLSNVRGQGAAPRARLFLGGVGAAVSADVCHRSAERLTVRHALPFLRLDSEVMDEEGRFARISSVRVYVENDVPTLHMELLYPAPKVRRDATLPYGIKTDPAPVSAPSVPLATREDDTLVFATHEDASPVELQAAAPPARPLGGLFARLARFLAETLFARFVSRPRTSEPALPSPRAV